jgi:hypothetical protein
MRKPVFTRTLLAAVLLGGLSSGCIRKSDDLTASEARQALEEASLETQAQGLTGAAIEISTSFTIGQAVQAAADEVRAFVSSQLPCAKITLNDATLTIEYGALPGNCTYRGHTFSGTTSIGIVQNDMNQVVVQHTWQDLSNGRVSLNGTATVTWDFQNQSRRVVHTATWTNVATGRTATGEGDRTQTVLEGGLIEGIRVDGSRSWKTSRGTWDLAIDGVEMRWVDPVPQAGTYTLATPFGKDVSMSFERQDADTIRVTIASGTKDFAFDVTSIGTINAV